MIYDLIMNEMKSRFLYLYDTYGPFYICSYAMHHFNLINRETDAMTNQSSAIFWIGGTVPDLRLHNLMIAPSGYMKTTFLDVMEDILGDVGISKMIKKSSMSEAAFIGSIKDVNGTPTKTEGVAEKHKNDMVMVGEFSALTSSMKATYNVTLAAQLLDVLDHGNVTKDLGPGGFHFKTRMTLWAGVQPSHYELSSGLGRRLCPLIFLPTKADDIALQNLKESRANIRKDYEKSDAISQQVRDWIESFRTIKSIKFAPEVYQMHKDLNLFQFESEYFDRLLLGYHLAKYGASEDIVVSISDSEIQRLIEIQKKWRSIIYEGIDAVMILKLTRSIMEMSPEGFLLTSRRAIATECQMVSWNKKDVFKKLKELSEDGYLQIVGEQVRWLGAT